MGRRPATLRDVAARAGVSVKTASNVVNDYVHVSDEVRGRVQAALDELGYRPNLSARHLRRGRSGIIALAVPDLQIPYFARLARHVIDEASARSLTVIIDQTDGEPERERLVLRGHCALLLDGAILSPIALSATDLERSPDTTPLVVVGERVEAGPVDHVGIDNVSAADEATSHLISLGRRRIAAIGSEPHRVNQAAAFRLRGYARALTDAGLPVDSALIQPAGTWHRRDGAAAMRTLLAFPEPPSAVFAFNDLLALGAVRVVLESGLRVPDDVAVVGFDDIEETRYSTPTLSTISPDIARIAHLALDLLVSRIEDPTGALPRDLRVPHRLRPRESTLGPTPTTSSAG